jgi:hypothetical protein
MNAYCHNAMHIFRKSRCEYHVTDMSASLPWLMITPGRRR